MAEPAAPEHPLTLEEKKAAARARAKAARQAQSAGAEALVEITPAAAAYIAKTATEQGMQQGVRLRILAGGCAGLEYNLDLLAHDEPADPGEREIESNGVRLLMDLKSAIHVAGSKIDYEDGLLRRGFRISNPNATSTCSCGDSFGA